MMGKKSKKSVISADELGQKLLQAVKEMKAGKAARVTLVSKISINNSAFSFNSDDL